MNLDNVSRMDVSQIPDEEVLELAKELSKGRKLEALQQNPFNPDEDELQSQPRHSNDSDTEPEYSTLRVSE